MMRWIAEVAGAMLLVTILYVLAMESPNPEVSLDNAIPLILIAIGLILIGKR